MQPQRGEQPAMAKHAEFLPVMEAATGWKGRPVPGFWAVGGLLEPFHCGSVREAGRSACFRIVWNCIDLPSSSAPSQLGGQGEWSQGDEGRLPGGEMGEMSGKPAPAPATASPGTAIIHAGEPMLGDMGSGRGNV